MYADPAVELYNRQAREYKERFGRNLHCKLCGKIPRRDFIAHVCKHISEAPFQCGICLRPFERRTSHSNRFGHSDEEIGGTNLDPKVLVEVLRMIPVCYPELNTESSEAEEPKTKRQPKTQESENFFDSDSEDAQDFEISPGDQAQDFDSDFELTDSDVLEPAETEDTEASSPFEQINLRKGVGSPDFSEVFVLPESIPEVFENPKTTNGTGRSQKNETEGKAGLEVESQEKEIGSVDDEDVSFPVFKRSLVPSSSDCEFENETPPKKPRFKLALDPSKTDTDFRPDRRQINASQCKIITKSTLSLTSQLRYDKMVLLVFNEIKNFLTREQAGENRSYACEKPGCHLSYTKEKIPCRADQIRRHVLTHLEIKEPLECGLCGKSLGLSDHADSHYETAHKNESTANTRRLIKNNLATLAVFNLFECFPKLGWIAWLPDDTLDLRSRKNGQSEPEEELKKSIRSSDLLNHDNFGEEERKDNDETEEAQRDDQANTAGSIDNRDFETETNARMNLPQQSDKQPPNQHKPGTENTPREDENNLATNGEIKSRFTPQLRYNRLLVFVFSEIRAIVKGERDKVDMIACEKPGCGTYYNKMKLAHHKSQVQQHVLTHLGINEPLECSWCFKSLPIADFYNSHFDKVHKGSNDRPSYQWNGIRTNTRRHIKSEIADKATSNLFECFPTLSWIAELPDKILAQSPVQYSRRYNREKAVSPTGGTRIPITGTSGDSRATVKKGQKDFASPSLETLTLRSRKNRQREPEDDPRKSVTPSELLTNQHSTDIRRATCLSGNEVGRGNEETGDAQRNDQANTVGYFNNRDSKTETHAIMHLPHPCDTKPPNQHKPDAENDSTEDKKNLATNGDIKSRFTLQLRYNRLLVFVFSEIRAIVKGERDKVDMIACEKPGCGVHYSKKRPGYALDVRKLSTHVLSHLKINEPLECSECSKSLAISDYFNSHYNEVHIGSIDRRRWRWERTGTNTRRLIKKEIADQATRNLFECFPTLSWIAELPDEILAQSPWKNNRRRNRKKAISQMGGARSTITSNLVDSKGTVKKFNQDFANPFMLSEIDAPKEDLQHTEGNLGIDPNKSDASLGSYNEELPRKDRNHSAEAITEKTEISEEKASFSCVQMAASENLPRNRGIATSHHSITRFSVPLTPQIRYDRLVCYIGFELRVSFKQKVFEKRKGSVACQKPNCNVVFTEKELAGGTIHVRRHVLTHLKVDKPLECSWCFESLGLSKSDTRHYEEKHKNTSNLLPRRLIRADLAAEATINLFECFPNMRWIGDLPDEILALSVTSQKSDWRKKRGNVISVDQGLQAKAPTKSPERLDRLTERKRRMETQDQDQATKSKDIRNSKTQSLYSLLYSLPRLTKGSETFPGRTMPKTTDSSHKERRMNLHDGTERDEAETQHKVEDSESANEDQLDRTKFSKSDTTSNSDLGQGKVRAASEDKTEDSNISQDTHEETGSQRESELKHETEAIPNWSMTTSLRKESPSIYREEKQWTNVHFEETRLSLANYDRTSETPNVSSMGSGLMQNIQYAENLRPKVNPVRPRILKLSSIALQFFWKRSYSKDAIFQAAKQTGFLMSTNMECIVCSEQVPREDLPHLRLRHHISTIHFPCYRPYACTYPGCSYTTGDPVLKSRLPSFCCHTDKPNLFVRRESEKISEHIELTMEMLVTHTVLKDQGHFQEVLSRMEAVTSQYEKLIPTNWLEKDVPAPTHATPTPPTTPVPAPEIPAASSASSRIELPDDSTSNITQDTSASVSQQLLEAQCRSPGCGTIVAFSDQGSELEKHSEIHSSESSSPLQLRQQCFGFFCRLSSTLDTSVCNRFEHFHELLSHISSSHLRFRIFQCRYCPKFTFNFTTEIESHVKVRAECVKKRIAVKLRDGMSPAESLEAKKIYQHLIEENCTTGTIVTEKETMDLKNGLEMILKGIGTDTK